MKKWLLPAVASACCIALLVFIKTERRQKDSAPTLSEQPAHTEVTPSVEPQATDIPTSQIPKAIPKEHKPEATARPETGEAESEGFRLPPGTVLKSGTLETPWEMIATGGMRDHFKYQEARQLVDGLTPQALPGFRRCSARYVPPPEAAQLEWYEGMVILDIQSSDEGYEVVNASITDASLGDPALEECLLSVYKGLRMPATDIETGRRYRLEWPVVFRFGVKEEMPEAPQKEG